MSKIFFAGIIVILIASTSQACTIGVANGVVTVDGRPILWKNSDETLEPDVVDYLARTDNTYSYITPHGLNNYIVMGLNETGVATGNTLVSTPAQLANAKLQVNVLKNYHSIDKIRDYIDSEVNGGGTCNATGCFPFIDAMGNAFVFEVFRNNWFREYDALDPDRVAQGLYGFVVRANEFHNRTDGTDDTSITGGRYESCVYNVLGLIGLDILSVKTIIQGNAGPNSGYELIRYGPGRSLATIARDSWNKSTEIIHGVAPCEDPALATMWVVIGQANYGIAVPTWERVSNVPQCLNNGDMYYRANSLYGKGNEMTVQASVFPAEAHMIDVVTDVLLPHWRSEGVPSAAEMTRIEHRMTNDAYSLLDCLDNVQSNNKAPTIDINAVPNGLGVDFQLTAADSDGTIQNIEWNFGDDQNSTQASPSHTYDQGGTYLVSCTVTDDDGVSISDWMYVTLAGLPDDGGYPPNATEQHTLVEDFESYADRAALIGQWSENGSAVLCLAQDDDPCHTGPKMMQFNFHTEFYTPESSTSFTPAEPNWTKNNAKSLSIRYKGDPDVEQLYVEIADGVNNVLQTVTEPNLIQSEQWTELNFDLAGFSPVNLTNVTTLKINVSSGDTVGMGRVYIDDIRLYTTRCLFGGTGADVNNDCITNFKDFAIIAGNWLVSGMWP